jgi:hypothetical protein
MLDGAWRREEGRWKRLAEDQQAGCGAGRGAQVGLSFPMWGPGGLGTLAPWDFMRHLNFIPLPFLFHFQPLLRYSNALLILPFFRPCRRVIAPVVALVAFLFLHTPRIRGLNVKANLGARNLEFRNIRTTSFAVWLGA